MKHFILITFLLLCNFFVIADQYRVELSVFETAVSLNHFKGMKNVNLFVDNNDLYRYYIGDFEEIATAEAIQKKAKANGIRFAKVINITEDRMACANSCTPPGKIEHIFFDFNQYQLRPKSIQELDKLGYYLQANPENMVRLNGHTDSRGSEQYNYRLSENRALSAKNYLLTRGIEDYRILIKEFGETTPIAKNSFLGNDSTVGRQFNRRVIFEILDKEGNNIADVVKEFIVPESLRITPLNNSEAFLSMAF